MKSRFSLFFGLTAICLFVFSGFSNLQAQSTDQEVILKFQRQENGKIATQNNLGQKVFSFTASGLTSDDAADNFRNSFIGRQLVISVDLSETVRDGERPGTITFQRGTKGTYIRDLLIKAGVKQISIDGVLQPVEELGKSQ